MKVAKRVASGLTICAAAGWLAVAAPPAHATAPPAGAPTLQTAACTYQLTNLRTGGYLNVRTSPATTSRRVGTLKPSDGTFTGSCAATRGWFSVTSSNGRTGWVSGHYLRRSGPVHRVAVPKTPSLTCTYLVANVRRASYLNVRSAPGVHARRVGTLRVSDGRFSGGCASSRGWVAVRSSNGRTGWAAAHYVRKTTRTPLAASASRPWGCTYQLTHVQPNGVVTVYKSRGTTYEPVGTLRLSDGRFGGGCTATQGWVPVTSSNGRPGWVSDYYLQRVTG
ncbi:SH3 domain-containing protein [Planotetraspora kaengkrachanensis]|uniref:SH3 domain-containing protein n=1 Tax=Planotetraspora kaengkrachanensis TaxID=575193 RepID=UPI0019458D56|nr:SH3 domain-containing protein [Planotetraspora kaengkrachanensis]